ncbi:MAG: tRNA pseudouridine38-40 synthase [Desulforhopalus sp.]|jgi:tRNA pseudouridine38-40 synthase
MPQPMRTIKLVISYDGTDFCGWQKQLADRTIQGELERCFSTMTTENICVHGAGRTDAGVHAYAMVAHFNCTSRISCEVLLRGANSMLPEAIRVFELTDASKDFHARYLATGKKYHYSIYTGEIQPPFDRLTSIHVRQPLNHGRMTNCLNVVTGTHDFSSFENSGSRDKTITTGRGAVRTIHSATILQPGVHLITLEFKGDGFLKNMVRNLVGTILEAGREKITVQEFIEILEAKDRTRAKETAPAHGLALIEVYYEH